MNDEIIFMPLGGGQRVGASCYYLKLGDSHIILDAGTGISDGVVFEPNLFSLLTSPYVMSLSQITQIFISHAHADHVGYLLKLMSNTDRAGVYMTRATALLSECQLYDGISSEGKKLAARMLFDKISNVSFMQTLDFGEYRATFYPAGHIPGAMMTLFEYGGRRILYTGDYSVDSTPLAGKAIIPEEETDTVIMCGLHAKHPFYSSSADNIYKTADYVLKKAEGGRSVMCVTTQLSKGIEFLAILNSRNKSGVPVYIGSSIMNVVDKMERMNVPVMGRENRVLTGRGHGRSHILLTSDPAEGGKGFYDRVNVTFSLHDDFAGMNNFIRRIAPRRAYIVHSAPGSSPKCRTIEQTVTQDGNCRTQFVFAEENNIYKL